MAGPAGEGLSTRPVLWQWLVDAIEQWTPLRQILGPLNGMVILESGASRDTATSRKVRLLVDIIGEP